MNCIYTNVDITVTESNEGYSVSYEYDGGAASIVPPTFKLEKAETDLVITNTGNAVLPTGITQSFKTTVIVGLSTLLGIFILLMRKKKYS